MDETEGEDKGLTEMQDKVWTTRHVVATVDSWVYPAAPGRREVRGQVPTGREAEKSNLFRVEPPVPCTVAHDPNGALRVLQRCPPLRHADTIGPCRDPVFEHVRGHPKLVEPLCHVEPLHVPSEVLIPAAGCDDNRTSCAVVHHERRESRTRNVVNMPADVGAILPAAAPVVSLAHLWTWPARTLVRRARRKEGDLGSRGGGEGRQQERHVTRLPRKI